MAEKKDVELFQEINEKLDSQVERLNDHLERFEDHEAEDHKKFQRLLEAQQKNTDALSDLTESVSYVVEGTASLIRLHKDFQGAARLGSGMQKFMLWMLKWGIVGTGVVAGIRWISEHFIR